MQIGAEEIRVGAQIGKDGFPLDFICGAFVNNIKAFAQANQPWPFTDNIMG